MLKSNSTDGVFRVSSPDKAMEFTGERMTTAMEGQIEFEHFHRYCFARDLCEGLDVLDVASGEGYGSAILANVARSVTGVEIDSESVAHAREAYRAENLRFLEGSALELPLADASADAVVSFETLEHVREHSRFVAEVKRVLRPAGRFIVSTPDRTVYSARGERCNEFHLLELTEPEFESLLRANFEHVRILRQRAILGSLIAAPDGAGLWRSYERRAPEYIEASNGLARAPYLVAVASDLELSNVASSVYLDRRDVGEVVGHFLQAPALKSQIVWLNEQLKSRADERDAQIVWLNEERTRLSGELNSRIASLATLQRRFDKLSRSLAWRFVDGLIHLPRSVGRSLRRPFVGDGRLSNGRPARWIQRSRFHSDGNQSAEQPVLSSGEGLDARQSAQPASGEGTLQAPDAPPVLDERRATVLVVTHEASRSGAPILSLNLIQQFSARYNVISLILGDGELIDNFRRASAALFVADRIRMSNWQIDSVIKRITGQFPLKFAIVNSVESRMVLRALNADRVPTVSLIHEFSAYTRPRSAIPDVIALSTETIFSTRLTLANAIADFWLYPSASIHVEPQGKCAVPASPRGALENSIERLWLRSNLRPGRENRKFLVMGAGAIQIRKGVDLFIECATILKNQPGGARFQFVWIGDGFDPENEMAYSVYLADQIKRAGIESQMKLLRSTSQIELAYQSADVLLIPSRLDPLPNVAIDALTLGLPVLCFEKTTGIADFLVEAGLADQCVARYLDANDLARKVKALADSDDLRAIVSDRSRRAAKSAFDMNGYASKIEAIAMRAAGAEARFRDEVNTILASGKFRSDFFKDPTAESLP